MIGAGDTATLVFETLGDPQRWDIATLRDLLIPIAADPAAAFAYGIPRDLFYTTAVRRIIVNPPALNSDTASWGFPPAVLDFLAEQGRSAREPRLRDLGLLSLYSRNPRRWADSVLARSRAGSAILEEASLLAAGVGRTDPRGAKVAPPDSGADWRQWYAWLGTRSGPVPQPPVVPIVLRSLPVRSTAIPFGESHARALAMFEVQTGRPVAAELLRNLAAATEDSARSLYTTMLEGIGATAIDAEVLAAQFRSGQETEMEKARTNLRTIFATGRASGAGVGPFVINGTPARPDSATLVEITNQLVAIALGAGPVWTTVEVRVRGLPATDLRSLHSRLIVATLLSRAAPPPAGRLKLSTPLMAGETPSGCLAPPFTNAKAPCSRSRSGAPSFGSSTTRSTIA
jgi:hypothetical protein